MKFGEQLKSARERQGLSLAELAARTKIRADYLDALEQGDLSRLPERTFARSYLQRYARELNVEPTALLSDFDRLMPMSPEIAQAVRGALKPRRRGPQLPAGVIASLLSALVVVGALAWGGYAYYRSATGHSGQTPAEPTRVPLASSRQVRLSVQSQPTGARVYLDNVYLGTTPIAAFPVDARDHAELRLESGGYSALRQSVVLNADAHLNVQLQKGQPTPALPVNPAGASQSGASVSGSSASGNSISGNSVSGSSVAGAGTGTAAVSAQAAAGQASAGQVTLHFVGRSWVRVQAGGRTLYEGIPAPGSRQSFPAGVSVRVGSAGAVQVSVGGRPAEAFGPAGRPLTRGF